MRKYRYYIYRIEPRPGAEGQFIGPFVTSEERDAEASRVRREGGDRGGRQCVYRANIEEGLVARVVSPSIVAA